MLARKEVRKVIPFHDVANLFPLMDGDEFKALMEDIRANGQREAIWTYEGKIVDGRNRYSAILRLQEQRHRIEPAFREWNGKGDLVAFVVSLNLHRRHLSEGQRAMIAAKLATGKRGGDRKSEKIKGAIAPLKQEQAAVMLNVSRDSVKRAAKVIQHGDTELTAAVASGEVAVSSATQYIEAATKYPQVAAIIPKSKPEEVIKIARNLDPLPEKDRDEKIRKLVKNDLPTLRELTNRNPVPPDTKSKAKEIAEWCFNARSFIGKAKRASFNNGTLEGWTSRDKELALDGLDLLMDDLTELRDDIIGGYTYDGTTEESLEGAIN